MAELKGQVASKEQAYQQMLARAQAQSQAYQQMLARVQAQSQAVAQEKVATMNVLAKAQQLELELGQVCMHLKYRLQCPVHDCPVDP